MKHFAIIPARKNSIGLKNKNRFLFDITAKFLKKINWFENILISTDDKFLEVKALKKGYIIHKRSKKNSRAVASIKSVMIEVCKKFNFDKNDIIWLFYLTIPLRNVKDFQFAKKKITMKNINSMISLRSTLTHPDDTWKIKKKKILKFTKNEVFRRQDKIKLFEHFHYISVFKIKELKKLNEELINENTYPVFIDDKKKNSMIEIDNKHDYQLFLNLKNKKVLKFITGNKP